MAILFFILNQILIFFSQISHSNWHMSSCILLMILISNLGKTCGITLLLTHRLILCLYFLCKILWTSGFCSTYENLHPHFWNSSQVYAIFHAQFWHELQYELMTWFNWPFCLLFDEVFVTNLTLKLMWREANMLLTNFVKCSKKWQKFLREETG